jgi:hypothetical protein
LLRGGDSGVDLWDTFGKKDAFANPIKFNKVKRIIQLNIDIRIWRTVKNESKVELQLKE